MPAKPAKWTSKREKFCRLIALHGYNASEAYKRAYDVRPETKPSSIHVAACVLRKKAEITARIEELQASLYSDDLVEGKLTLEQHLANLKRLQDLAVESGQIAPAITAENYRGKASGLYIEKTINADVSLADLVGPTSPPNTKKPPAVKPGASSKRRNR